MPFEYCFDVKLSSPKKKSIIFTKEEVYLNSSSLCFDFSQALTPKSEYVELERKQALERAYPIVEPFEEAPLSINPMSIEPQAELPDDMRNTFIFVEMFKKTIEI